MTCSCLKGRYDFSIRTLDTGKFEYTDLSEWMEGDDYTIPVSQPIFITLPNGKEVQVNVRPKGSTIITSQDLGISSCLSDGSYCFSSYECKNCKNDSWGGRKYSKTVSIMSRLDCRIKKIFTEDVETGMKLQAKLRQIESVSEQGQEKKAAKLYKFLNKEVNKHNCQTCDC